MSWLTVKLKAKFTKGYVDPKPDLLLAQLKEYILDVSHSCDVTTNSIYDPRKLQDAVSKYYQGNLHFRTTVDWWLTFELWKQSLSSQHGQAVN